MKQLEFLAPYKKKKFNYSNFGNIYIISQSDDKVIYNNCKTGNDRHKKKAIVGIINGEGKKKEFR